MPTRRKKREKNRRIIHHNDINEKDYKDIEFFCSWLYWFDLNRLSRDF